MIVILLILSYISTVLSDLFLLLLHTNDMHARFEQVDRHLGKCKSDSVTEFCYGGFARLHEMARHFKTRALAEGRATLFLNAGDTFQGTPYYSQFKWKLAAKMINTLDLDVISLGNHEFDDGIESLAHFIESVKIPIVCCNLDRSRIPALQKPNFTSSKILLVNGTKVGIVGYLTPTVVENYDFNNLKMSEEIFSIRVETQRLKDEGVQIIIGLGHSGYDVDLEIASKVEDIDVVVGGHTHTFLYSGEKIPDIEEPSGPYPTVITQASGKQVPVVQAFYGTKYLGYLELNFDSQGNLKSFNGSPVLLMGFFPQDPYILQELKPYKAYLDLQTDKIIGYTHTLLDNNNFKCKVSECEIGNLIADAFTDYMVKYCPSITVSVGLVNAGSIGGSFDPLYGGHNASITIGDIMTIVPSGAPIAVLNLSGRVLLEVLEHTVTRFKDTKISHIGNFLQVSGLRVTYNLEREIGRQVTHVKVLCMECKIPWFKPLELNQLYGVAMPQYLARGGDGFTMLTNLPMECVSEEGGYAIVSNYIKKYSPVNPKIEGRIKIAHGKIKDIILPMLSYFFIVLLVIYIFRHTILAPINHVIFSSTDEITRTP